MKKLAFIFFIIPFFSLANTDIIKPVNETNGFTGKIIGGVGGSLICGTTGPVATACIIAGTEIGDRVGDWLWDKITTKSYRNEYEIRSQLYSSEMIKKNINNK